MAYTRKLPSGKHQGIAVHPTTGKQSTRTYPLQGRAKKWAEGQEATWRRNHAHDPRAGEMPVGEWVERWRSGRVVERTTADKDASQLRVHILPKWKTRQLASIDRLDVGEWVKEMQKAGVGPHTIGAVVRLFATILAAAVEVGRIDSNPAARQRVPKPDAQAPRYFTPDRSAVLLAALPGQWRVACALDTRTGLRLGELLGLKVEYVDWERVEIHVVGVLTRHGWRAYPKSKPSNRTVPIPGDLLDDLLPYLLGRGGEEFVFTAPEGGPCSDVAFRNRIWYPAMWRAGLCAEHAKLAGPEPRKDPAGTKRRAATVKECPGCAPIPRETPHCMRHTAASWLVMDGVDLYRVQSLLGHESFKTTQRYAHLAPGLHDRIREAWKNMAAPTLHDDEKAPTPEGGEGL